MALQPSTKTPVVVPADIWINVSQFVSHADLCTMFGINRVFFKLSMDARYRELSFSADSDPEVLWKVQRARDPSISHRVRRLFFSLPYEDLIFVGQSNEEGELNPGWAEISLWDGIQMMTETVTFLTNVTDFLIEWVYGVPLVPFLTAAWKTFGSGLLKFSITTDARDLAMLLSIADGPVALRDLSVTIDSGSFDNDIKDLLCTSLAPYVNKVAPNLRSLSYSSALFCSDPSLLFHHLEKIPNLEKLSLTVWNRLDILAEPFSATRFLCNHATTLRHLEWDGKYGDSADQLLLDFQSGYNMEEAFSNLCTLHIGVPKTPDGIAMALQRISLSSKTLTSLALVGHEATYEEVNIVISIFQHHDARNLKELSLRVKFLSPELILLLNQTLPFLEKLAIYMTYLTGQEAAKTIPPPIVTSTDHERRMQENAVSVYDKPRKILQFFPLELLTAFQAIFANTIRTYDFRDWALHDIQFADTIWKINQSTKLMWAVADCVPSVKTFCGKEKELYVIEPRRSSVE